MALQSLNDAPADVADAPESSTPYLLSDAATVIREQDRQWRALRAPTPQEWPAIAGKLARAEQAMQALMGLHDLVREHHFAQSSAKGMDMPYHGITDYQAGAIEGAIDYINDSVYSDLYAIREGRGCV